MISLVYWANGILLKNQSQNPKNGRTRHILRTMVISLYQNFFNMQFIYIYIYAPEVYQRVGPFKDRLSTIIFQGRSLLNFGQSNDFYIFAASSDCQPDKKNIITFIFLFTFKTSNQNFSLAAKGKIDHRITVIIRWCFFFQITRWWFQFVFLFTPLWGTFPFWLICFSDGLVQPPTRSGNFNIQSLSKMSVCPRGEVKIGIKFLNIQMLFRHFWYGVPLTFLKRNLGLYSSWAIYTYRWCFRRFRCCNVKPWNWWKMMCHLLQCDVSDGFKPTDYSTPP